MKLLIVDDHAVVRHGLRQLFSAIAGTEISEAATIEEAELLSSENHFDVVVLDLNLGGRNGLSFAQELAGHPGAPRVVILTMHADAAYARQAMAMGALGYVAKTSKPEHLLTAVRRAARGERYLDPALALAAIEEIAASGDGISRLSARERDILRLIGDGRSMTEIAAILGVAYKTVANTALRLRDKLGAKGQSDLVRIAIESRERLR